VEESIKTHRQLVWLEFLAAFAVAVVTVAATSSEGIAQQTPPANAAVPTVVQFSGTLRDETGKPESGPMGVTDHPLDPANKYLYHASVELSEMMNIYTGNITTDGQGEATVQLPEWFEDLNTNFRYQLTVIGQFAQAIVAREIQNHEFATRTSTPKVKVSWQATGVRQDAYAKAHPLVVEEEKEGRLRGFYIHPELYGAPEEKGNRMGPPSRNDEAGEGTTSEAAIASAHRNPVAQIVAAHSKYCPNGPGAISTCLCAHRHQRLKPRSRFNLMKR
jgi:hypothetical protein